MDLDRFIVPTPPEPTLRAHNDHPQLHEAGFRDAMQAALGRLYQMIIDEGQAELATATTLQAVMQLLIQKKVIAPSEIDAMFHAVRTSVIEAKQAQIQGPVVTPDDLAVSESDLDCTKHHSACGAACCSTFNVYLTPSEAKSNRYLWDITHPYKLLGDADNTCVYFDRENLGCTIWEHRPKACRAFDCRGDERVWSDYPDRILSTELMERRAMLAAKRQATK